MLRSHYICFTQQFKNTFRRQQPLDLNFTPPSTLRMPPLPFQGDSTRRTSLNSHAIQIQPTCTSAEEKLDFFPNLFNFDL